mmetsp:Transcript_23562/g.66109  ORF Transcript_23562/g.66109 Transcript_23562/m.66109 type:complete len:363 (-) Transcript_23562:3094-4182(-)
MPSNRCKKRCLIMYEVRPDAMSVKSRPKHGVLMNATMASSTSVRSTWSTMSRHTTVSSTGSGPAVSSAPTSRSRTSSTSCVSSRRISFTSSSVSPSGRRGASSEPVRALPRRTSATSPASAFPAGDTRPAEARRPEATCGEMPALIAASGAGPPSLKAAEGYRPGCRTVGTSASGVAIPVVSGSGRYNFAKKCHLKWRFSGPFPQEEHTEKSWQLMHLKHSLDDSSDCRQIRHPLPDWASTTWSAMVHLPDFFTHLCPVSVDLLLPAAGGGGRGGDGAGRLSNPTKDSEDDREDPALSSLLAGPFPLLGTGWYSIRRSRGSLLMREELGAKGRIWWIRTKTCDPTCVTPEPGSWLNFSHRAQ